MSPRQRHLLSLIAICGVLGGAVYGWWYLTTGRFALVGAQSVNFGEIALTGQTVRRDHVFELRNRTARPVVITTIRPSCGCTALDTSGRIVAPGEYLTLPIAFNLAEPGPRSASITLVFDDDRTQTLWVRGTARRMLHFQVVERSLDLGPERDGLITMLARIQDHDDPPQPPEVMIPTVDGLDLEVEFTGWELMAPRQERRKVPASWRGHVRLSVREGELTRQGIHAEVTLDDSEPYRVLLRGEPVRTERTPTFDPDDPSAMP